MYDVYEENLQNCRLCAVDGVRCLVGNYKRSEYPVRLVLGLQELRVYSR